MMVADKVFLASKSPRRLELLRFCFENVQQIQSLRDEPLWNKDESAENYLKRCLEVKALGAEEAFQNHMQMQGFKKKNTWNLVIAADTIVVLKGEIFGKPGTPARAIKMLQKMMGQQHTVMTAYSVDLFQGTEKKESCRDILKTKVKFRKAPLAEVKAYVKTGEPMDKSGSYGVQGPAMQFVESVEGSYQSVMGIPLFEIQKLSRAWTKKYL